MMKLFPPALFWITVLAGAPAPVQASETETQLPGVVVTTSLIETAVRDLMGQDVEILRLLPPGSCPGHFDLEPRQVAAMASARLFIRHDYQAGLDEGLAKSGMETGRIVSLTSYPSFAIPGKYAALGAELGARLIEEWPGREARILHAVQTVQQKADDAERDSRQKTERLQGRRLLCAQYQRDFCEWLGLNVVAVFHAGADGSAWQLNRAVDMARTAGAEAVIGNRQWGPRHLKALSEATRLPGIMLSNYPEDGGAGAYWKFFDDNIEALLKGLP